MSKTTQLAKIRVGIYDFKIIKKPNEQNCMADYYLYRTWHEWGKDCRMHERKILDGKFEFYHDALRTVANYQEYYFDHCRVPSKHEISV